MTGPVDVAAVARGVGRGLTVMLIGGVLVVAVSSLLGPATGLALTAMAVMSFATAAWQTAGARDGALAGAGTYLAFLPLTFLGGDPPSPMVLGALLAGAAAVGAAVGWWKSRRV